jgi:hypothetical protein
MKPHKHAELIKAWADGATIQVKFTLPIMTLSHQILGR